MVLEERYPARRRLSYGNFRPDNTSTFYRAYVVVAERFSASWKLFGSRFHSRSQGYFRCLQFSLEQRVETSWRLPNRKLPSSLADPRGHLSMVLQPREA